jgi:hypothetical protein
VGSEVKSARKETVNKPKSKIVVIEGSSKVRKTKIGSVQNKHLQYDSGDLLPASCGLRMVDVSADV